MLRSSPAIRALTEGCARRSTPAARLKLPCRATSRSREKSVSSMVIGKAYGQLQLLAVFPPEPDRSENGDEKLLPASRRLVMRVLRLLRQPIPLAVWLGQLFSVTGDKLYAMAVLWL